MNDKRKLLLKKAHENDGILTWGMASTLYSSNNSTRNALASLEFQGYIENVVPGQFRVKKLPEEVRRRIEQ